MNSENNVYKKCIELFGIKFQSVIAMEELSELIKAISKFMRCSNASTVIHLLKGIADVEIMCNQIKYYLENYYVNDEFLAFLSVNIFKQQKLARLVKLIEKREKENV